MSKLSKAAQTINAQVLRDETVISANTNDRVYQLLKNIIDSMIDYQQFVIGTANGVNTLLATIPGIESYSEDAVYVIRNTDSNSGASTLNITGVGAKAIKSISGVDLTASDLLAGGTYILSWSDADDFFRIIGGGSSTPSPSTWGGLWNFASNSGNFPTATGAGILYVAEDDHGVPGDADYVPAGTWMVSKITSADQYSEFYYK